MLTGTVVERASGTFEQLNRVCNQPAGGDAAGAIFEQTVLDLHSAQGRCARRARPRIKGGEHPRIVALDDAGS